MEWNDCQADIDRFQKMNPDELKAIVQSGVQTEFWKWLRANIASRMRIAEFEIRHSNASKFDHLIELGEFNKIYQVFYLLLNLPEMYLNADALLKQKQGKEEEIKALKQIINAR